MFFFGPPVHNEPAAAVAGKLIGPVVNTKSSSQATLLNNYEKKQKEKRYGILDSPFKFGTWLFGIHRSFFIVS